MFIDKSELSSDETFPPELCAREDHSSDRRDAHTIKRSAGDLIQSVKQDGDVYRRGRVTPRESIKASISGMNIHDHVSVPVIDIFNCVGPVERVLPYLKGTLLQKPCITPAQSSEEETRGFCATDLKALKQIHHRFKEEEIVLGPTSTEDRFPEMKGRSLSKDPEFRYAEKPSLVLLILRKDTPNVLDCALRRICHLRDHMGVNVLLEPDVLDKMHDLMDSGDALRAIQDNLFDLYEGLDTKKFLCKDGIVTWKDDLSLQKVTPYINFGIILGGDGTVLWTSLLFPKKIPPLLCVAMGSLGYLAGTRPESCQTNVTKLLQGVTFTADLRCRLEAYITDPNEQPVMVREFFSQTGSMPHQSKGLGLTEDDILIMTVLNDIVISKASYGQLCTLDCHINGQYFTTCSSDGLIVATPTGSTAYNMSAGGSIVHPGVPAMLFTPICPHSLSFRPLVLPDTVVLSVKNPVDNRNPYPMIICRDGFGSDELKLPPGYTVHIRVSTQPIPLIIQDDERKGAMAADSRWLTSLTDRLNWNYRKRQLGKVVL